MAKRKVIKFVFQGHRAARATEYYTVGDKSEMFYAERDHTLPQYVYHKIEAEEEVPKWRAVEGDFYYFAGIIDVLRYEESGTVTDNLLYKSGNYFQTKEEAQEYLDHCKKFFENN